MPAVDQHPAGNFVWMELATNDQAAAKNFYSSLFGWTPDDFPIAPDEFYTMFSLEGRQTGAAYTLKAEDRGAGVPSNWLLYIGVEDADATVKRAEELGGTVMSPAFDVMTFGRMAVLRDPTGAIFAIWQPRDHKGVGLVAENGALSCVDLQTTDRTQATNFYGPLFGWEFALGKDKSPGGYLHIVNQGNYIGGLPPERTLPPGVPPHWLPYVQTADCGAATSRASELGARVLAPPTTIEGSMQFSVVADPQGAVFALYSPGK